MIDNKQFSNNVRFFPDSFFFLPVDGGKKVTHTEL